MSTCMLCGGVFCGKVGCNEYATGKEITRATLFKEQKRSQTHGRSGGRARRRLGG